MEELTDKMILLKKLIQKDRTRLEYYIRLGRLKKIETEQGFAVLREDVVDALSKKNRGKRTGTPIDLSKPSKINCLYRKIRDMNDLNRRICLSNSLHLKRYIDENDYLRINLKEYIAPQIRVLASKLEMKESEVFGALFDLIYEKYKELEPIGDEENG